MRQFSEQRFKECLALSTKIEHGRQENGDGVIAQIAEVQILREGYRRETCAQIRTRLSLEEAIFPSDNPIVEHALKDHLRQRFNPPNKRAEWLRARTNHARTEAGATAGWGRNGAKVSPRLLRYVDGQEDIPACQVSVKNKH